MSDLLTQAILGGKSGVDWEEALYQGVLGAITGGGFAIAQEAGKGVGGAGNRSENVLNPQGELENNNPPLSAGNPTGEGATKPYTKSRPSYGKTQVDDVWNNYKDPVTGKAKDPAGESLSWDKTKPRQGQWDMGHIPGEKYSNMYDRYIRGEISQKNFLEWYRNPTNYRPELPSTNRSHKYE